MLHRLAADRLGNVSDDNLRVYSDRWSDFAMRVSSIRRNVFNCFVYMSGIIWL